MALEVAVGRSGVYDSIRGHGGEAYYIIVLSMMDLSMTRRERGWTLDVLVPTVTRRVRLYVGERISGRAYDT